jgi:hypothetical protein
MEAIAAVAFSPDGARVLTGSLDKTAGLWDAAAGEMVAARGKTETTLEFLDFIAIAAGRSRSIRRFR